MSEEKRRENSLAELNEHLRLSRHYTEYDTDALRALEIVHKWLSIYDAEGTATHAEYLAYEALGTLFDHIHNAELAHRFLNQGKTRQGASNELAEDSKDRKSVV